MFAKEQLLQKLNALISHDSSNCPESNVRIFDPPVIGFCRADDPLFIEMKKEQVVGNIFRAPEEWLPGARAIIAYFLPFTEELRRTNRSDDLTSVEWLHGRFKGEEFNRKVRQFIIQELEAAGGRALAPALEEDMVIDHKLLSSSWSERHVAYIAGLGTFGLSRGMITEKGMAGRFGSVITDLELPPTPRPYKGLMDYCLSVRNGSCGVCINRCPAGAVTEKGMDKAACRHYAHVTDRLKEIRKEFGYAYSACGKCQTNVPCEAGIPQA